MMVSAETRAGVVTSDTVIERGGTADSGNPVTKIVVKIIIRNYRKLLKSKIRYTILIEQREPRPMQRPEKRPL